MMPKEIAGTYFAAMRAQDVEALLSILNRECVIIWPDGRRIEGHDAIRATYTAMFQHPSNNPQPGPLMVGHDCFSVEVLSKLADGSERKTINVFELADDGLVARMSSYRQG